jgi:hypothetical protein
VGRVDAEPARDVEVDVWRRLSAGDLLRGDRGLEEVRDAQQLERKVDQLAVRGGREAQAPPARETLDGLARSGDGRQKLAVKLSQAANDLAADLLGRLGQADHVVHVPGPLERAHAHHVPLGVLVPAAAMLPCELLAGLVPDLLRVEEDAVEVEDDGLGHSAA